MRKSSAGSENKGEFLEVEFRRISKKVQKPSKYNLELLLRVKNFKARAPLTYELSETWKSIVGRINKTINRATDEPDNLCVLFQGLCIKGIRIPTASVLLAVKYPMQFAIIDKNMFKFFKERNAYNCVKKIFKLSNNKKLKKDLRDGIKDLEKEFTEISKKNGDPNFEYALKKCTWGKIYRKYLKVLEIIRDLAKLNDLREVEWNIYRCYIATRRKNG